MTKCNWYTYKEKRASEHPAPFKNKRKTAYQCFSCKNPICDKCNKRFSNDCYENAWVDVLMYCNFLLIVRLHQLFCIFICYQSCVDEKIIRYYSFHAFTSKVCLFYLLDGFLFRNSWYLFQILIFLNIIFTV